jgi:hypothetical protein
VEEILWDSPVWQSLISESQFAVELTHLGLRRLCQVPTPDDLVLGRPEGTRYALHVGMHSFTSGLERLCKLAISCYGYCTEGKFPNLRQYSHSISKLLGALEGLDFEQFDGSRGLYLKPEPDPLDPELTTALDRFSQGMGRYEYLDSLASTEPLVDMFTSWCELCARSALNEEISSMLSLRGVMPDAIFAGCNAVGAEIEPLIMPYIDNDLGLPMFRSSVAVAMALYRKARWAAACLSAASTHSFWHQRSGLVPLLSEIVDPALVLPSSLFFECHVARFGDAQSIEETVAKLLAVDLSESDPDEVDEVDEDT